MKTLNGIKKSTMRLRTLALFGVAALAAFSLNAAAPTAGTQIGNQASATYEDQNGTPRETTSNTVITTVLQIPGLALTQDNTRTVSPGGSVFFPHTLTNTGNGTDSFDLLADNPAGDFTLGTLTIYADTNRDGQPDDITSPITTTNDLTPGESFYFVVGTTVPGTAADGESATFDITGTSDLSQEPGETLLSATNTDTVNVSTDAVITVTKLIDQAEGVPGTTPITYTLSYNNTGNTAATEVTLVDEIPVNMTYIAASGLSSLTGSTVLTDADDGAQPGGGTTVDYKYESTVGPNGTLTVVIGTVPAGASGTITFQVGVDTGIAPQIIFNEVEYTYDPDGPGGKTPVPPITTNRPPFEVLPVPEVELEGDTVPEARPGETVVFNNALTNNGNATDTFDMTIVSVTSTYPPGTTFVFFQADGNTPMVDTNGNGIPDTGPVAGFGGTYNVVVKANLPTNINLTAFPGPYAVDKRATGSVNDVNGVPATDDATDDVTTILPPTVDITNALPSEDPDDGAGDGTDTDGLDFSTDPGLSVIIPFTVENEGNIPDAYNLTVDPATVPAGWVVNIRKVAGGAIVNNTGPLNPPSAPGADGQTYTYVAQVIVPAGESPADYDLTFRATSPTSGAFDEIINTVTVNTVREIGLISDNAGQISPGGSIVYEHIISNLGNVTEALPATAIALGLSDTNAAQGWTSVIHLDANDNGILDASDPIITSLPAGTVTQLGPVGAADDSARLFVKVFAPLGAPNAAINVTTITATPSGTINGVAAPAAVSNEDTTTVILGDLVLLKEQALDLNNDGAPDNPYSVLPQSAKPGETILYRVTATNTGSALATDIMIYDTTPTATTYDTTNGGDTVAYVTGGSVNTVDVAPVSGASGSFEFNVGDLAPGDSATIGFGVTIDE
jgi:uncharacterized repeat protein (TIGR01451 family)